MAGAGMHNVASSCVSATARKRSRSSAWLLGGTVIAADAWGEAEHVIAVPEAVAGSHEDLLHRALGADAILDFGPNRSGPWLGARLGHRAIGVVYDPRHEHGNFVPTTMGLRYDSCSGSNGQWRCDRSITNGRPPSQSARPSRPGSDARRQVELTKPALGGGLVTCREAAAPIDARLTTPSGGANPLDLSRC